jgi:hypothetical protein
MKPCERNNANAKPKKKKKQKHGVQINLSITLVHPQSTHAILQKHYVKFQAPIFKFTILLLVYKLFYVLCCLFF